MVKLSARKKGSHDHLIDVESGRVIESMCAGASQRSRRVILRFLMDELIERGVEDFYETFESRRTHPTRNDASAR